MTDGEKDQFFSQESQYPDPPDPAKVELYAEALDDCVRLIMNLGCRYVLPSSHNFILFVVSC